MKSRVPCTSATREGRACRGRALCRALLGRPAPRAARVLRAPTRRVSPRRNCSDVKSRVPYTLGHTGGPRLSRPDLRRRRPTPHPRPNPQPPTHIPAREVPVPPSARGVRTGLPRWLALTHEDPDIGRGARPARPSAPHARARLGCWTPRRAPRRGRAAGDVGPYHSPTRTHLAPTILPPAPTWPLPFSHPHPLGPYHSPTRTHIGPYHSPARTHLAPTILSPAPTWPRRWLYNGPAREVPAPPSARDAHSLPPYASIPCASRAPRNSPPKI